MIILTDYKFVSDSAPGYVTNKTLFVMSFKEYTCHSTAYE